VQKWRKTFKSAVWSCVFLFNLQTGSSGSMVSILTRLLLCEQLPDKCLSVCLSVCLVSFLWVLLENVGHTNRLSFGLDFYLVWRYYSLLVITCKLRTQVFCNITLCCLVSGFQCFEGLYFLYDESIVVLKTMGTTHPTTQCHIPEHFKPSAFVLWEPQILNMDCSFLLSHSWIEPWCLRGRGFFFLS
jgi:hypothetical protein